MKNGDRITLVQDALVLENLINQLVAGFMKKDDSSGSQSGGEAKANSQSPAEEAKP